MSTLWRLEVDWNIAAEESPSLAKLAPQEGQGKNLGPLSKNQ